MNKIATNDASIYNVDSSATYVHFEHWQFKRHRYECFEGPVFLLGPTRLLPPRVLGVPWELHFTLGVKALYASVWTASKHIDRLLCLGNWIA